MSDVGAAVVELDAAPSLPGSYLRAVLPRSGDRVPSRALRLRDVRPTVEQVARYAHLCGFGLTGSLPLTYPHLLGFPLQLSLMADRAFPFPATGLVHVANVVVRRGALPVGAALDVTVHATGPYPHRRGRTVEMHTEVATEGETAWTSTSTYLRRGPGSPDAATADPDVPGDLPTTAVWRLPADLGRRYATVSGDRNPIHTHRVAARAFGFRRVIAHGMWTAAAAAAAVDNRVPSVVRYGVAFRAPVLLPCTVELAVRLGDEEADLLLRSGSGRPLVLGRISAADAAT